VPAGSVSLGFTSGATPVHVRTTFDEYSAWTAGRTEGVPGVYGRLTSVEDRSQRTALSYDLRGNVVASYKELAVMAEAAALTSTLEGDGRPAVTGTGPLCQEEMSPESGVSTANRDHPLLPRPEP